MYIVVISKGVDYKNRTVMLRRGEEITDIELAKRFPRYIKEFEEQPALKEVENNERIIETKNEKEPEKVSLISKFKNLLKR